MDLPELTDATIAERAQPPHDVLEVSHSPLMSVMLRAVAEAGLDTTVARASRGLAEAGAVAIKQNASLGSAKDYVTKIDLHNQRLIFGILKEHFPDIHAYGEELGADRPKADPKPGDRQWVLDPIDSTRNLVAGTPHYSISLGCQEFRDGKWHTIAGAVGMPAQGKILWAEEGKGAFELKTDGSLLTGPERSVMVDKHHKEGLEAFDARAVELLLVKEAGPLELPVWQKLNGIDRRMIRQTDSGAMALASLGSGLDGIVTGGLTEHDKTAGLLIAREAGGVGAEYTLPYTPDPKDSQQESRHTLHVLAADKEMLAELRRIVESALKQQGITPVPPTLTISDRKRAPVPQAQTER